MTSVIWNPWHGCHKISPGCHNCYMYRRDAEFGKDSSIVTKTRDFDLPIRRNRYGKWRIPSASTVYVCMTSDFFIEEADGWREEIWAIIKYRSDLRFTIVTKRIDRFSHSLPADWRDGYTNVTICSTCETQKALDYRAPILLSLPLHAREFIHEPLLEDLFLEPYLASKKICRVIVGGESGPSARLCEYSWILHIRNQCLKYHVPFLFKQTGALFQKDGIVYRIPRKLQMIQAKKAGIDVPSWRPKKRELALSFERD